MSIPEFLLCFGIEAQCAEAVKQTRWPDGFRCPRCDSPDHCVLGEDALRQFKWDGCRKQIWLTAGSLTEYSKLPLTTWFLAVHLIKKFF